MDRKPTPREWKAIGFFALMALSMIVAVCAMIEMTFWSPGPFTGAFAIILVLRFLYSAVSMFSERIDPRHAKRPPDPP